jgi:hypothetical protein
MRETILVGSNPVGACQTRGLQTSQALKKYCSLDAPYVLFNQLSVDIKDTIIIFVGEPISYCNGIDNLIKLKENNNILIYDIIDNFCFQHTNPLINKELINIYQHLDVMLHPNKLSQYQLNSLLPNVEHIFMPHQWDFRNEDVMVYENVNTNKAAYIGGVAGGFQLDINKVKDYVDVYEAPLDVNTHHLQYGVQASFRKENSLEYLYKPCTKLAMASSFAAILLTSREPAVVDIVGDAYEFYIDSELDLINQIEKIRSMSNDEIDYYRYNTKYIKEYLSPKQNAYRYNNIIKKYV